MHIVSGVAGIILIGIAVYKIVMSSRGSNRATEEGIVIWGLIGEKTSQNGPITIKRIIGPRGNGEPILVNRAPGEDKSRPWTTHRNGEGEAPFFEWQWRDRTEDDPGDAYYTPSGGKLRYQTRRGIATIKTLLYPSRWWEFKKLSSHSDGNTERIYERK